MANKTEFPTAIDILKLLADSTIKILENEDQLPKSAPNDSLFWAYVEVLLNNGIISDIHALRYNMGDKYDKIQLF